MLLTGWKISFSADDTAMYCQMSEKLIFFFFQDLFCKLIFVFKVQVFFEKLQLDFKLVT